MHTKKQGQGRTIIAMSTAALAAVSLVATGPGARAAAATSTPTATATATTTVAPSPVLLKPGDRGQRVRNVQVRLKIVGTAYWPGAIDGVFGASMSVRVAAFQRAKGLPQTRVIDQRTWDRLRILTDSPVLLRQGSTGNNVREAQLRLKARGYWPYAVNGSYGATMAAQVLRFQQNWNLPQRGVIDRFTWTRLVAATYTPGTFDAHRFNAGLRPLLPTVGSLDARCRTGRVLCISKKTRQVVWVVGGRPLAVLWARFGRPGLATREGTFTMFRKKVDVISNIYFSPMPYSMFFSGGQAVHYSSNFARLGYTSASHGCVNVKDLATLKSVYAQVRVGDRVVVHH